MSEPVTHAEIEDVLSSIRRLVSEDGREPAVLSRSTPTGKPAARLVLTPSLRVADAPADTVAKDTLAKDTLADDALAEDTLASLAEPQPDETNSESGSSNFESRLTESHDNEPEMQSYAASENEQADDEPEAQLSTVSETEQPDGESNDEPVVESLSVGSESHGDDTILQMGESTDKDLQAGSEQATDEAPWQDPGATLFAAAGVTEGIPTDSAEAETLNETKPVASFAEKIAALEAAIGQADEQWEPDGEAGEANAGTPVETLAWEDLEDELVDVSAFSAAAEDEFSDSHPQVDITPEIAPEFEQPTFDSPEADPLDAIHLAEQAVTDEVLGGVSADETVMDEESLRELVADIVREELQGALGERITRNVRKLVRREIHRALAVQDLG